MGKEIGERISNTLKKEVSNKKTCQEKSVSQRLPCPDIYQGQEIQILK